ncbi:MAG: hypothetical protein ACWGOY_14450 [Anaerolineales bacterium]
MRRFSIHGDSRFFFAVMYFNMWQAGVQLQNTLLIIFSSAPSSEQISGIMPVCHREYRLQGYSRSKTIIDL